MAILVASSIWLNYFNYFNFFNYFRKLNPLISPESCIL